VKLRRLFKHLITPDWLAQRRFPAAARAEIAAAVADSERRHRGEICIVIEGPLPLSLLWQDVSPRQRALEHFALRRVWDTEENSGVLIYVQLIDRCVEIVADRGIAKRVPQTAWDEMCRDLEAALRAGRWKEGILATIGQATRLLAAHFPARQENPNELPDMPWVR